MDNLSHRSRIPLKLFQFRSKMVTENPTSFILHSTMVNNFPNIIRVLPKNPQARTAVRDITPIYATASISLKQNWNWRSIISLKSFKLSYYSLKNTEKKPLSPVIYQQNTHGRRSDALRLSVRRICTSN